MLRMRGSVMVSCLCHVCGQPPDRCGCRVCARCTVVVAEPDSVYCKECGGRPGGLTSGVRLWRRRVLVVPAELLAAIFTSGSHGALEVTDGLPTDARVLCASWDAEYLHLTLVVESDEFEEVPEGNAAQRLYPVFRRTD